MGRKQLHKGYERRQHDKQHDRERNAYRKAKRKGLTRLMDEITLLKEEVHMLQQQYDRDQRLIQHQQDVNAILDARCHELENRVSKYRMFFLIGALVIAGLIIYLTTGVS